MVPDPCTAILQRVTGPWRQQNQTKMQSWWDGEMVVPGGGLECPGMIWLKAGRVYLSGQGWAQRRRPLNAYPRFPGDDSEDQRGEAAYFEIHRQSQTMGLTTGSAFSRPGTVPKWMILFPLPGDTKEQINFTLYPF